MKFTYSSALAVFTCWSTLATAYVTLDAFPGLVQIGQSYELSWSGTDYYNYTLWLVMSLDDDGGFGWDKVQSLFRSRRFETLNASYTWTVPSTLDTEKDYGLWLDGIPYRFDGESYANITEYFRVTRSAVTTAPASTTASATASASPSASGVTDGTAGGSLVNHHANNLSGGAIAGIVIGVLAALALIGAAAFIIPRRRRAADVKRREAAQRASRLDPVMQESSPAIEMHPRLGKDIAV